MKRPVAFITGIAGFGGSHLAEELLEAGFTVHGSLHPKEPTDNIESFKRSLKLVRLDILNAAKCRKVLESVRPDYIFHLAALASVGKSFSLERETYRVNFEGSLNVFQAARPLPKLSCFLFVSSGDCYGRMKSGVRALTEEMPQEPTSPYGIAKVAAEQAGMLYFRQYGLPVVVARAFTHAGPRQSTEFAISSFARQIALIEAGRGKPRLEVGDLSARRDFSDVRDIVRGYRLLATKGRPGRAYNLCSGKAVRLRTVLDRLVALSTKEIRVKVMRNRLRKNDLPVLRGSCRRAERELGYDSRYSLQETLGDSLNYWRERISV